MNQLESNLEINTKQVFEKIIKKNDWTELIEWGKTFTIDSKKFDIFLRDLEIPYENGSFRSSFSTTYETDFNLQSPLEMSPEIEEALLIRRLTFESCLVPVNNKKINYGLLEQALCASFYEHNNLNDSMQDIVIVSKHQVSSGAFNKFKQFFKLDLKLVPFIHENEIGYGIYYRRKPDTNILYFYGTAWKKLSEKSLVVQIMKKGKILKELWLKGVDETINQERLDSFEMIL